MQSNGKCLADVCGALHCDAVMNTKSSKIKCNPAAAARNRHLCEVAFKFVIHIFACSVHLVLSFLPNSY